MTITVTIKSGSATVLSLMAPDLATATTAVYNCLQQFGGQQKASLTVQWDCR